ncbi:uncharacterized protein PSFLO_00665 [Pseudozyma flocculosa]|uniref:Uncharacterized protein n=1 Tax=Pseudozyma flocculosa TaxID=84751 RepID=A0A5C3ESA2_9BASI|nr:uncharacterized protein PSFLO_00665 [Pseudozyma flocculosa]
MPRGGCTFDPHSTELLTGRTEGVTACVLRARPSLAANRNAHRSIDVRGRLPAWPRKEREKFRDQGLAVAAFVDLLFSEQGEAEPQRRPVVGQWGVRGNGLRRSTGTSAALSTHAVARDTARPCVSYHSSLPSSPPSSSHVWSGGTVGVVAQQPMHNSIGMAEPRRSHRAAPYHITSRRRRLTRDAETGPFGLAAPYQSISIESS